MTPDPIEAVARAMAKADNDGDDFDWLASYAHMARAAIAAMPKVEAGQAAGLVERLRANIRATQRAGDMSLVGIAEDMASSATLIEQQAARIAELEADKADLAEDTHRLREICDRKVSETLVEAIAAVEAERLCDPQNEEDGAYDRAIDDAIAAIRALTPEPDTIGYVDDTGGPR